LSPEEETFNGCPETYNSICKKKCKDNKFYQQAGRKKKTCGWIGKKDERIDDLCPEKYKEKKYLNGVRRPVANAKTTSIELLTRHLAILRHGSKGRRIGV
jgi:hypothetical protein